MKFNIFKAVIIVMVGLLAFSLVGFADYAYRKEALHPDVQQALHEVKEVVITGAGETSKVWDIQENPESVDIVYVDADVAKADFSSSQWNILRDWMKDGHTVWVDTERNSAFLKAFGFSPGPEMDGGLATSTGAHNVLTDVGKVSTGPGVELRRYDVPLLQRNGEIVAALNYLNRGLVIATGTIRNDKHDGNRLLANLYEFGAGYPVPPSIQDGEGVSPSGSYTVKATLKSGETLTGTIVTDVFQFRTPYGNFNFYKDEISFISVTPGMDLIELRRGDRLLGTLSGQVVRLRQPSGEVRTVRIRNLSEMVWR
ncbi:hypothetical protein K9M78_01460 [Candidatus Bipolaricaulota bacterium]|nr:hypothetical protein [Candidatus Bipolaricaulota bacterium]